MTKKEQIKEFIAYQKTLPIGIIDGKHPSTAVVNLKITQNMDAPFASNKLSKLYISGARQVCMLGQSHKEVEEIFRKNPENLILDKNKFDKLMEIWKGLENPDYHKISLEDQDNHKFSDEDRIPDDIYDFITDLTVDPEFLEIEENLDKEGGFVVTLDGIAVTFDSSFISEHEFDEEDYKDNVPVFRIQYQVGDKIKHFHFGPDDEEKVSKRTLNRRDVLAGFLSYVDESIPDKDKEMDAEYGREEAMEAREQSRIDLKEVGFTDIQFLNDYLVVNHFSEFAGIHVKDGEICQKDIALKL